jgi:hypothetical protein
VAQSGDETDAMRSSLLTELKDRNIKDVDVVEIDGIANIAAVSLITRWRAARCRSSRGFPMRSKMPVNFNGHLGVGEGTFG